MKYAYNKAFPHPVLRDGSKDYGDSAFQTVFEPAIAKSGKVEIDATFMLSEKYLLGLIAQKRAAYGVVLNCPSTHTRIFHKSHKQSMRIEIPPRELHERMECCAYVVAEKHIRNFHSPGMNAEFAGARFEVAPGDVLAVCEPQSYYCDLETIAPIGTILQFAQSDDPNQPKPGEFAINWEGQKIRILMQPDDKSKYDAWREVARKRADFRPHLLLGVHLSMLTETLREMQGGSASTHEGKKWFRTITSACGSAGVNIDELDDARFLGAAQKILKYPLGQLPARGKGGGDD